MYNLAMLDAKESIPFPNHDEPFSLPADEYGELIWRKLRQVWNEDEDREEARIPSPTHSLTPASRRAPASRSNSSDSVSKDKDGTSKADGKENTSALALKTRKKSGSYHVATDTPSPKSEKDYDPRRDSKDLSASGTVDVTSTKMFKRKYKDKAKPSSTARWDSSSACKTQKVSGSSHGATHTPSAKSEKDYDPRRDSKDLSVSGTVDVTSTKMFEKKYKDRAKLSSTPRWDSPSARRTQKVSGSSHGATHTPSPKSEKDYDPRRDSKDLSASGTMDVTSTKMFEKKYEDKVKPSSTAKWDSPSARKTQKVSGSSHTSTDIPSAKFEKDYDLRQDSKGTLEVFVNNKDFVKKYKYKAKPSFTATRDSPTVGEASPSRRERAQGNTSAESASVSSKRRRK